MALAAIKGDRTVAELASVYGVHLTRLSSITTAWMSASRSYIQRASKPAMTAPMIGANENSHSCPIWPLPPNRSWAGAAGRDDLGIRLSIDPRLRNLAL